jgi:hypothetical protein
MLYENDLIMIIIDKYIVNEIKDVAIRYSDTDFGKSYFINYKGTKKMEYEVLGSSYVRLALEIILVGYKMFSSENNYNK